MGTNDLSDKRSVWDWLNTIFETMLFLILNKKPKNEAKRENLYKLPMKKQKTLYEADPTDLNQNLVQAIPGIFLVHYYF